MKTTRFNIRGMTCGHCRDTVAKALENRPGVRTASIDLDAGAAEVQYDETQVAPEQLVAAIEAEGYRAEIA